MRGKFRFSLAAIVFMAAGVLVPTPAGAAGPPTPALVAAGFDSPRGVEFFKGKLVVGEAGHGGKNCIPGTPTICFGRTSQISWVNTVAGTHTPLVDHLFSAAEFFNPDEGEALGVDGISARDGKLMAILGVFPQAFANYHCAAGDSECAADVDAAKKEAGALLAVKSNGSWHKVAGVGAFGFNYTANIPNQEHDSNPYGVLAVNGGSYVADAGSNTLEFVSNGGHISVLHYFPFRQNAFPSDEVPTCIAKTDDGLWVATLAGNLYRVHGRSATLVANSDLKHVTGCAADGQGNVYFVNMWTTPTPPQPFTGNIVKLDTEDGTSSVIAAGLNFPNMDVVGPDGNLYFSADSICPTTGIPGLCAQGGTVWKLALPHDNEGDADGHDRRD
ncbi:MAG: SMP-30/gluconolactonase/LRE family protein [Chloroflexi bacterium]|nr:MAG: SMP-30/gluconolactonase/LRE family protein [Chloroflexota bacterium]